MASIDDVELKDDKGDVENDPSESWCRLFSISVSAVGIIKIIKGVFLFPICPNHGPVVVPILQGLIYVMFVGQSITQRHGVRNLIHRKYILTALVIIGQIYSEIHSFIVGSICFLGLDPFGFQMLIPIAIDFCILVLATINLFGSSLRPWVCLQPLKDTLYVAVYIVSEDGKDTSNQDKKDDWCKNRSRCMYMYICCDVYIFLPICVLSQFAIGFYGFSICPAGSYGPFVLIAHAFICLICNLARYRIRNRKCPEYMVTAQLIIGIVGLMIYGFLLSYGVPDHMLESRNAQSLCYVENALYLYLTLSIGSFSAFMIVNSLWKRCLM